MNKKESQLGIAIPICERENRELAVKLGNTPTTLKIVRRKREGQREVGGREAGKKGKGREKYVPTQIVKIV